MSKSQTSMPKTRSDTHSYISNKDGKAVIRIRTPHAHDVLSGRGGGINAHTGNKRFRDWVHVRKEAYNLANNKQEKVKIAMEVINLVKRLDPPGRFLAREENPHSGAGVTGFWIEIDENKAIAKTSQALREGAPRIKAEHGLSPFAGSGVRSRPTSAEKTPKRSLQEVSALQNNESAGKKLKVNVAIQPQRKSLVLTSHPSCGAQPQTLPGKLASPEEAVRALASAVKSAASHHDQRAKMHVGKPMGPPMPRSTGKIASKLYSSNEAASKIVASQQQGPPTGLASLNGYHVGPPRENWHSNANRPSDAEWNNLPVIGQHQVLVSPYGIPSSTKPLMAQPSVNSQALPTNSSSPHKAKTGISFIRDTAQPLNGSSSSSNSSKTSIPFYRSHSLATSDDNFDPYGEEFRNPFDDELMNGLGVAAESNPLSSAMLRSESLRNIAVDVPSAPSSNEVRRVSDASGSRIQGGVDFESKTCTNECKDHEKEGLGKDQAAKGNGAGTENPKNVKQGEGILGVRRVDGVHDKTNLRQNCGIKRPASTIPDTEIEGNGNDTQDKEACHDSETNSNGITNQDKKAGERSSTQDSEAKKGKSDKSGSPMYKSPTMSQIKNKDIVARTYLDAANKVKHEEESVPSNAEEKTKELQGNEDQGDEKASGLSSKDPTSLPSFGIDRQKSTSSNVTNLSNLSQFSGLSTFSNLGSTASSLSRRLLGSSSSNRSQKKAPPAEIRTC